LCALFLVDVGNVAALSTLHDDLARRET
jgi:hypothetical protein